MPDLIYDADILRRCVIWILSGSFLKAAAPDGVKIVKSSDLLDFYQKTYW
jgi:hypothetical protein